MGLIRDLSKYEFRVLHNGVGEPWENLSPMIIDLSRLEPSARHIVALDFAKSLSVLPVAVPNSTEYAIPLEIRFNRLGSEQGYYVPGGLKKY